MTEVLQALLLGVVQGITEFAPVSSTAHLLLVPWLFNWESPLLNSLNFDVALHLGTLLATLTFFRADWLTLLRAGLASIRDLALLRRSFSARPEPVEACPARNRRGRARDADADDAPARSVRGDPWRRLFWLLVIATVPGALAGALLEKQAETAFRAPWLVASAMILLGLVLALAERAGTKRRGVLDISPGGAIAVGLGQALAIVPGVSRSGGTITAALFVGLRRDAAARFSFLLATPIMAGAGAKKITDLATAGLTGTEIMALAAGFVASAVAGYLCIKFLLRYLQNGTLNIFIWYRLLVGALVLVVFFLRG